jgi:hypothetical protein
MGSVVDGSPHAISSPRRAVGMTSFTRARNSVPVIPGIQWTARTSGTATLSSRNPVSRASADSGDGLDTIRECAP